MKKRNVKLSIDKIKITKLQNLPSVKGGGSFVTCTDQTDGDILNGDPPPDKH